MDIIIIYHVSFVLFDRKFGSLGAVGSIGWVGKQPDWEPAGTAAQSETSKPQAACLGFQVMKMEWMLYWMTWNGFRNQKQM
jgi:hypothetical protein